MDNHEFEKKAFNKSHLLSKTTRIFFWLYIAKFLLYGTFMPMGIVISIVHVVLILRLGSIDPHFRTAGIIEIISLATRLLIPDLSAGISDILRDLAIQCLNLLWAYHEYTGFSKALAEFDSPLSDKWRSVRNWYIGANAAASIGITLYSYAESILNPILLMSMVVSFVMDIVICFNYWKTSKL